VWPGFGPACRRKEWKMEEYIAVIINANEPQEGGEA
jgi:hypothetical protein